MTSRALVDSLPDASAAPIPDPTPARSTIWSDRIAAAGLATLGAALGASQLLQGVYNETAWAPIALGALGLLVALAVASPRLPPMALLAPVLGLWLWSLASAGWSDSTDAAHIAADRWLLYAAAIVVLAWALARDRRRAIVLLTSASTGVLVVAAWMLARMLDGNGQSLFLATRLNDPLGYVNGQAAYLLVAAWPCLALAEHRGSRASGAIAGIGMASLVALIGLGLLCQSRSWEVALAAAVVVLEVAVPGRRRRAAAIAACGRHGGRNLRAGRRRVATPEPGHRPRHPWCRPLRGRGDSRRRGRCRLGLGGRRGLTPSPRAGRLAGPRARTEVRVGGARRARSRRGGRDRGERRGDRTAHPQPVRGIRAALAGLRRVPPRFRSRQSL